MKAESRVQEILARAIGELAKASSEAAANQDFFGSNHANSVAVQLAELAGAQGDRGAANTASAKQRPERPTARLNRTKPVRGDYPKFYLRNGTLCRIGWSRKGKSEYAHKVPKAAFDKVVRTMAVLARKNSGPHTGEEVMDELRRCHADVPAYQMYVTLGLLNERRCLQKNGREGYIVPTALEQMASEAWDECEKG
jgi:hypothetical protein